MRLLQGLCVPRLAQAGELHALDPSPRNVFGGQNHVSNPSCVPLRAALIQISTTDEGRGTPISQLIHVQRTERPGTERETH